MLKDGRSIGTYKVEDVTPEEISRLMVGRDVKLEYDKTPQQFGNKILTVENLCYTDKFGTKKLDNLNFSLKQGEVLGIAGIEGNGQKEAMEILTGNMKAESGAIHYRGEDLCRKTIRENRRMGIAHVPEDRNLNGSAPEMSVRDNLIAASLDKLSKGTILDRKAIEDYCEACVEDFRVKTSSLDISIKSLSGGNIQKAIVGREFLQDNDLLIIEDPTRGIDVGAKYEIYLLMDQLANSGVSIIMISSEMPEIMAVSDRIMVMHEGTVTGELSFEEYTEEDIMKLASGEKQSGRE